MVKSCGVMVAHEILLSSPGTGGTQLLDKKNKYAFTVDGHNFEFICRINKIHLFKSLIRLESVSYIGVFLLVFVSFRIAGNNQSGARTKQLFFLSGSVVG